MSTNISMTQESILREIDMLKLKYHDELIKDSTLAVKKEIRLKIKELETLLDSLLKTKYPDIFN